MTTKKTDPPTKPVRDGALEPHRLRITAAPERAKEVRRVLRAAGITTPPAPKSGPAAAPREKQ